jgi:nicotinate phosphoribosyltransferase
MDVATDKCLLTDYYQLTMGQAYFNAQRSETPAFFNLYFRDNPFDGHFAVAAGLKDALSFITSFEFSAPSLEYLAGLKNPEGKKIFSTPYLEFLGASSAEKITVHASPEGTVVFPHEPLLQIQGPLFLLQLLETPLLNIINFQTLIATKAMRMVIAALGKPVFDFGLRRAHGFDAAVAATKAAYLGGVMGSSNVWACKNFNIAPMGTMGHSFVLSFANEQEAFSNIADTYQDGCSLLVDTFASTSGVKNAIPVLAELKNKGFAKHSIRLDSGDLSKLSREARTLLDQANLHDCRIFVSGDLDEHVIAELTREQAPIDGFGVGTKLVTGGGTPSLGGVYKLSSIEENNQWRNVNKISDTPAKTSLSGRTVLRRYMHEGKLSFDTVCSGPKTVQELAINMPFDKDFSPLEMVLQDGKPQKEKVSLEESRDYCMQQMKLLPSAMLELKATSKPFPVVINNQA